jgi:hypothetical protein
MMPTETIRRILYLSANFRSGRVKVAVLQLSGGNSFPTVMREIKAKLSCVGFNANTSFISRALINMPRQAYPQASIEPSSGGASSETPIDAKLMEVERRSGLYQYECMVVMTLERQRSGSIRHSSMVVDAARKKNANKLTSSTLRCVGSNLSSGLLRGKYGFRRLVTSFLHFVTPQN